MTFMFPRPVSCKSKALISLGMVAILHGYAYFTARHSPTPLPMGLALIADVVPVYFWGTVWALCGVGAIWAALYKPVFHAHPVKTIMLSLMVFMFNLWGLAYLVGWMFTGFEGRTWVIGCLYIGVASHIYFTRRLVPGVAKHESSAIPPYHKGG